MKKAGIILSIMLIIILSFYFTKQDSRKIKELHNEYKSVQKGDQIDGIITDLYVTKGACFVTIDSSKVFFKTSANFLYEEVYLDMVLDEGILVKKKSGSDTLIVYKTDKEYFFELGSFINKK